MCLPGLKTQVITSACRSELVAQATSVERGWLASLAQAVQLISLIGEQLSRWTVYRSGLKLIGDLFGDIDCLLPPAGPLSEVKLSRGTDDYQVSV